ncbi:hypothetical protein [Microvirgula curvata]
MSRSIRKDTGPAEISPAASALAENRNRDATTAFFARAEFPFTGVAGRRGIIPAKDLAVVDHAAFAHTLVVTARPPVAGDSQRKLPCFFFFGSGPAPVHRQKNVILSLHHQAPTILRIFTSYPTEIRKPLFFVRLAISATMAQP